MSDQALGPIAFGEFVELRGRKWLSQGAEQLANELNVVRLSCIEDDAQGEEATVIWDSEIAAHTATDALWGAIGSEGADTAATFSAWLKTVDWNSTSVADKALFQPPFRAGIRLDPYQLDPLQKALDLPRANMLIADDVGLGKTIEAGLVLREMLLRGRVNFVVIACPPSMIMQWHEELGQKFGIAATVLDRSYLAQIRRRRGFGTNPWASGSCFLVSHRLLADETYASGLREVLGPMRANSMLILDEAHHAAPASGSRYAIDSQFTRAVRDIAQGFEHRLFLSATPHNGHSNSFTALLEILDPHRFTRGVPVETADLEPVMVRRLKSDLRALGEHFPERVVEEIRLDGLELDAPDLRLSEMLEAYGAMRDARLHAMTARERAEGKLVFSGLQQRLLSSPEAFKKTLEVQLRAMKAPTSAERSALAALGAASAEGKEVDGLDEDDLNYASSTADDVDDDPSLVVAATKVGLSGAAEPAIDDEKAFVKSMLEEARKASLKPDARVKWIASWVRQNMAPNGQEMQKRPIEEVSPAVQVEPKDLGGMPVNATPDVRQAEYSIKVSGGYGDSITVDIAAELKPLLPSSRSIDTTNPPFFVQLESFVGGKVATFGYPKESRHVVQFEDTESSPANSVRDTGVFFFVPTVSPDDLRRGIRPDRNKVATGSALVRFDDGLWHKIGIEIDLVDRFSPFVLGHSVGSAGVNDPLDVFQVQQRLRYLGFPGGTPTLEGSHRAGDLEVDGRFGKAGVSSKTEAALRLFAAAVSADGRGRLVGDAADKAVSIISEKLKAWLNHPAVPAWMELIDKGWSVLDAPEPAVVVIAVVVDRGWVAASDDAPGAPIPRAGGRDGVFAVEAAPGLGEQVLPVLEGDTVAAVRVGPALADQGEGLAGLGWQAGFGDGGDVAAAPVQKVARFGTRGGNGEQDGKEPQEAWKHGVPSDKRAIP